jgi:predicted nuclease of predicted toxin-antitoxin system
MRFLADECCDFAAVRALRAHGHDVLAVCEFQRRSVDKELVELALAEDRILLTEDKDFGWLVFAGRMDSPGVILIRFPASARRLLVDAVLKLVSEYASRLVWAFVVLRPGEARISFGPHHPQ